MTANGAIIWLNLLPANIYLFKVNSRNPKDVKYVQSAQ